MPQYLSRDRILPRILDYTLIFTLGILLDLNDAGGEALLELLLMLRRDGSAKDDVGKKAV